MDYVYNNGELYHARQYSHKYIDRQWRNGRWVYTYPVDGQYHQLITSNDSRTARRYRKWAQQSNKAAEYYRTGQIENQRDYKNKLVNESKKRNAATVNLAAHSDPKRYVEDYIAKAKHAGLFPGPKAQPKVEKGKKWFQNIFSTQVTIKELKTGKTITSYTKPGWGLFKKK